MPPHYNADGNEYLEMVSKRIARNQAFLESIGLATAKKKMNDMTRTVKRKQKSGCKGRARKAKHAKRRTSKRLSDAEAKAKGSSNRVADDDQGVGGEFEEIDSVASSSYRSRKYGVNRKDWDLSEGDKASLKKMKGRMDDVFLMKFKEFLVFHNQTSEQNTRNVMRQIRKLANGDGIRYESAKYGWPEGCFFMKGTRVTPLSDVVELLEEAQKCEDKWGRDHGNGWLLSHPLKKLLLFQQFLLNNPNFLTMKCKLKDYYALEGDE